VSSKCAPHQLQDCILIIVFHLSRILAVCTARLNLKKNALTGSLPSVEQLTDLGKFMTPLINLKFVCIFLMFQNFIAQLMQCLVTTVFQVLSRAWLGSCLLYVSWDGSVPYQGRYVTTLCLVVSILLIVTFHSCTETLDLHENDLTGPIPSEIARLTNLSKLALTCVTSVLSLHQLDLMIILMMILPYSHHSLLQ
jgi:hypothetical protein